MKLKKVMALGMTCAMMLSMAAPTYAEVVDANVDPANTEKTDEAITIALASEPSTLLPPFTVATENEAQIVYGALVDTLVVEDKSTGEILPNLAASWEWTDDTHCKFTLRDDIVMSDGSPLVADDVAYCVNDIWVGMNASNDTGRFMIGAEVNDEQNVTIEYNIAAPDLLSMMTWTNFGIVSKEEIEAAGGPEAAAKNPTVGCGKYKFVEWKNGEYITLERNEEYWNPDYAGYFKTITFKFINDPSSREANVESGDVDVAYDMPVIQASTFAESENVKTVIYDYGQVAHVWYNMTEGHATADVRVRQAIDKALDFDNLAVVGTAGYGAPALGYVTTKSQYHCDTYTAEERAVDIEGAKALLEEAGYGDGLSMTTLGMQDTEILYTVMKENLRQIGIDLTINTVDTPTFVQDANGGNYDIIMVGE